MTKNKLTDLNNHLFEQLERLRDVDGGDALSEEIERSKAVTGIAKNIIDNGSLVLEAEKFVDHQLIADKKMPSMLVGEVENDDSKKEQQGTVQKGDNAVEYRVDRSK